MNPSEVEEALTLIRKIREKGTNHFSYRAMSWQGHHEPLPTGSSSFITEKRFSEGSSA